MLELNETALWLVGGFCVLVGILGIIFRNSKWMNN